ncbi:ATP-grasp domain-containing protein [Kribbella endophytica]
MLPFEFARTLRPFANLVFVVPQSLHAQRATPVLRALGEVRSLDDALAGPRPDGVVTFSERMLRSASQLAAVWNLPGHSAEVVELVTDKYAQRRRLAESGVDSVRCHRLTRPEDWRGACDEVGFPLVLKPSNGEASRDTYLVHDRDSGARLLEPLLRSAVTLVAEEFLHGCPEPGLGDYVSVESVTSYGQTKHIAVTGKLPLEEPFRETGQFWPCHLPARDQDEIMALAGKAIGALGISFGISHTEVKLTPSGPRIIEVNGRLGGNLTDLALRAANLDLVSLAAKIALGQSPAVPPVEPKSVYFQRYSCGPTSRARLRSFTGGPEVGALAGITRYQLFAEPGAVFEGGTATAQLDFLSGQAESHTEMRTILDRVGDLLDFDFTTAEVEVSDVVAGVGAHTPFADGPPRRG